MTIEAPSPAAAADDEFAGWMLDSEQLAATREKIAKLNARAARKGFTGRVEIDAVEVRDWVYDTFEYEPFVTGRVVLTRPDGQPDNVPTHNGNVIPGMWVEIISYRTTITGDAPCYEGWIFTAILDWDPAAGLIVRAAPGADPVDRSSLREGWCDECQTVRYRSETYLVINRETGEQRQVGSTCIKDFLGWTSKPAFLDFRTASDEIDDLLGGWSVGGYRDYSTLTALAVAWAVIKIHGFVPASQECPTKGRVLAVLDPVNNKERKAALELAPVIDQAYDRAREVRAFILSDAFSGASDYVINLKAVLAADNVTTRNLGLLASAPQAHARHIEQTLIRERRADMGADSQWIGQLGERLTITGTLVGIRYMGQQQYGYSVTERTLYTVLTDEGNIVKLWNSHPEGSDGVFGDTEGVQVTFKATVKKADDQGRTGHDEYKGRKETTVQRPANVVITEAAK